MKLKQPLEICKLFLILTAVEFAGFNQSQPDILGHRCRVVQVIKCEGIKIT